MRVLFDEYVPRRLAPLLPDILSALTDFPARRLRKVGA